MPLYSLPERSRRRLKALFKLSLVPVLILAILIASQRSREERTLIPSAVDSFYLPAPKTLKWISLGQQRMVADLIWIKTLMYFGEEIMGRARQTWLAAYANTVLALDPKFERAWEWAGSAMIYNGRVIDSSAVKLSIDFYERGLKHFPDNWKMASSLGFNLAYELHPKDPVERSKNRKRAIKWFLRASKNPQSPPYIKQFALTQMDKEGFRLMAVRYVKEAYAKARNAAERRALEKRLKTLLSAKDATLWTKWSTDLKEGKEAYLPYGSLELFILLGYPEGIPLSDYNRLKEIMGEGEETHSQNP